MPRDPRIDEYIARQAPFARPILAHLRETVHAACPEAGEGIRWGMPAFLIGDRLLATMAAFKAHAAFGFWRAGETAGDGGGKRGAMGQFGRLADVSDLPPPAELEAMVRKAAALAIEPARRPARPPRPEMPVPDDLRAALEEAPDAAAHFAAFPPSARRDYAEWIAGAKRPETRAARLAEAIEWIAQGKRRNWKYERK